MKISTKLTIYSRKLLMIDFKYIYLLGDLNHFSLYLVPFPVSTKNVTDSAKSFNNYDKNIMFWLE